MEDLKKLCRGYFLGLLLVVLVLFLITVLGDCFRHRLLEDKIDSVCGGKAVAVETVGDGIPEAGDGVSATAKATATAKTELEVTPAEKACAFLKGQLHSDICYTDRRCAESGVRCSLESMRKNCLNTGGQFMVINDYSTLCDLSGMR